MRSSSTHRASPTVHAGRSSALRPRTGGPVGNERLTATTGTVLLVLLAALGVTIVFIGQLIAEHIFIGMLLIAPLVLKLASTGYRFMRYYTGNEPYRRQGPPPIVLRLLAPLLIIASVVVFASGVALLLVGPGHGLVLLVHKASFIVWGVAFAIHALAYVWRVPRLTAADWRAPPPKARPTGGSMARRLLVAAAIAAGLILAIATLPLDHSWLDALG